MAEQNTNKMSQADAARIQSTQAKGGHDMSSSGFAARAQAAAAHNTQTEGGQGHMSKGGQAHTKK